MTRRSATLIAGGLFAVLAIAALLAIADLDRLRAQLATARPLPLLAAAALALLSYAATAGIHRALLARLGHAPGGLAVLRAVFVAIAANRSLRSGGATGFAVLAFLLGRHGVPAPAVLASCLGLVLLTQALFCTLLAAAVVVAALTVASGDGAFRSAHVAAGAAAAGALLLGLLAAVTVVRSTRATHAGIAAVSRVARIVRRQAWEPRVRSFLEETAVSARLFRSRGGIPPSAVAWGVVRLLSSLTALQLCGVALDLEVPLAVLLFAYTAGKVAASLSFVPGGIGLVEGSLAGVLAALGVPFDAALAMALLNRATYHLLPTLVAAAVAGRVMREARAATLTGPPAE